MVNTLFTQLGREKIAKAHAGLVTLPIITHIAFGTGGHVVGDISTPIPPDDTANTLLSETVRKVVESKTVTAFNTVRYSCKLLKTEANGQVITEAGLFDEAGDLIAIKHFGGKTKENDTEFWFDWEAKY